MDYGACPECGSDIAFGSYRGDHGEVDEMFYCTKCEWEERVESEELPIAPPLITSKGDSNVAF